MTALLRNEHLDSDVMLDTIRAAGWEHGHALLARGVLTEAQWGNLEADLNCCLELDQFDFAMVVERRDGVLMMRAMTEPGCKKGEQSWIM